MYVVHALLGKQHAFISLLFLGLQPSSHLVSSRFHPAQAEAANPLISSGSCFSPAPMSSKPPAATNSVKRRAAAAPRQPHIGFGSTAAAPVAPDPSNSDHDDEHGTPLQKPAAIEAKPTAGTIVDGDGKQVATAMKEAEDGSVQALFLASLLPHCLRALSAATCFLLGVLLDSHSVHLPDVWLLWPFSPT
jgi:hypothetical protein